MCAPQTLLLSATHCCLQRAAQREAFPLLHNACHAKTTAPGKVHASLARPQSASILNMHIPHPPISISDLNSAQKHTQSMLVKNHSLRHCFSSIAETLRNTAHAKQPATFSCKHISISSGAATRKQHNSSALAAAATSPSPTSPHTEQQHRTRTSTARAGISLRTCTTQHTALPSCRYLIAPK